MIFKTLNTTISKSAYDITIRNIDASANHWGSEKDIINSLDNIETLYLDQDNFNKKIVLFALDMKKYNLRIKDIKFYRIPELNKLIILAITQVPKFKEAPVLEREMNILLKKQGNFSFSVVELLEEEEKEMKEKGVIIPETWKPDEYLNTRYGRLKEYV